MDLVAPAEQVCSFHHFHITRARVSDNSISRPFVLYPDSSVSHHFSKLKATRSRKRLENRVSAVSKSEASGLNGRLQQIVSTPNGDLNVIGMESSPIGVNGSRSFEEFASNIHLRKLVRNGELEEGLKFLERMIYQGDIPDVIACTSLIRGFCRSGKTKKATRIMEILENSGAVPDVITYNVLIGGYCKSGEIDKALEVLERMSVAPDVVTYNTILRSLCDSGKLKEAMEVLDRQLQRECYPDVITYTILIEATCNDSGVGQAMKLLDEMRKKGCKPDVVTYNVLINGI